MSKTKAAPAMIKKANNFNFWFLKLFIRPALYLIYRFRFDMKSSRGIKRPCLILANHQTGFDQLGLSMGFGFGINYVATDTIFRHGLLSKIMVLLVRPIPFSKGSSDLTALKHMINVIKSGGSVAMFPSGNRCCYGVESDILPGIGRLAKKFDVPLVLVQFQGGYNTLPRWKAKKNLGKVIATVVRIVSREELSALGAEEVDSIIQRELKFNEFEFNRTAQITFRGKHKAEYLESMLFYCPQCGVMNSLRSRGNEFFCTECEARVRINGTGFFERIHNAGAIPETILEWSELQLEHIKNLDYTPYGETPFFTDGEIQFSVAERAKGETLLGRGQISLFNDRVVVCDREFPLTEVTMALVGVRNLSIYARDNVYAIKGPWGMNLMKYMICGYHLRNMALDIKDGYYGY